VTRGYGATLAGFASLVVAALFVACGSRTGLLVPTPDASNEPVFEGGPLDVQVDCASPTYCDPSDLGYIWKCGERIFQCSSLEQCEETESGGESGAQCVNPCLDSLGNNTSNGCEFYAVEMDTTQDVAGVCYAVFVVNQWKTGEPARIEVSQGTTILPIQQFARIPAGQGTGITYQAYDPSAGLPTNQIAILFLSRDPNAAATALNPTDPKALASCPPGVVPAIQGDASLHGTGIGTAFHIKTNVPVVAYQMLPYGGGSARVTGSTLLLPTSAWDVNYLVADAYRAPTMVTEPFGSIAGPTTVVIGSQDGTTVTVRPTADIEPGQNIGPAPQGQSTSYVIDQGHYLQFTQTAELTGTAIQADKPVAVIGGSTLMDLPLTSLRADSAEQMLAPVRALGSEYVGVRYRSRSDAPEVVPWRLVGAVDGTVLTYEPSTPQGAPSQLQAQELAELDTAGPFVVRSQDAQHPFYLASYMTGGQDFQEGTGDPEFVSVVPPAQFLPRYTFFTDPTYPETNLVIVRVINAQTQQWPDVSIDCAGTLSGWTPVGTSGVYEMVRFDLSTGDFQGVNGCDNGVHVISSDATGAQFGVTVWGWGNDITWPTDNMSSDELNPLFTRWVSYGYPAGANFAPLNTAVLDAK
jgi:hypothetical protein